MYRKFLIYAFFVIMVSALAFISAPLFQSLTPNDGLLSKYPHFNISKIELNKTIEFQTPLTSIFVTKISEQDSKFSVHYVPMRNGYYLLPEFDWTRLHIRCKSFRYTEAYQCVSLENTENCEEDYPCMMKWDKQGKYIGPEIVKNRPVSNLPTPKYEIKGNDLILLQM